MALYRSGVTIEPAWAGRLLQLEEGMATIVLVHGIGQENKEAEWLRDTWLGALREGLTKAGQSELASQLDPRQIVMAYYGSLFRPQRAGAMGSEAVDCLPPEGAEIAEQLAEEWINRAANRAEREDYRRDGKRALQLLKVPPAGATPMGVRNPVRRAVAAAAKIRYFAKPTFAVAERVVNRALRQVSLYVANINQTREKALAIVHECVAPETAVMIAHSLGSVVAYEACHQLKNPLPLLITLGSPLGLDSIVYQRTVPRPPAYPPMVRWWVNVADRDDIVAADVSLAGRFPSPVGHKLTDHDVENRLRAHDAVNYLRQPEVAYPLALTLRTER